MFCLGTPPASDDDRVQAVEDQEDKDIINPKSDYNFNQFSVSKLKELLEDIEPVALNRFSTKALIKRGKRAESRDALLEIFELCTNCSPLAAPLTNRYSTLGAALKMRYEQLGCRARSLKLPPDWLKDGIYELLRLEQKMYVRHRFMDDNVAVQPIPQWFLKLIVDVATLYLVDNFSEERAGVRCKVNQLALPFNCFSLFNVKYSGPAASNQVVARPTAKRTPPSGASTRQSSTSTNSEEREAMRIKTEALLARKPPQPLVVKKEEPKEEPAEALSSQDEVNVVPPEPLEDAEELPEPPKSRATWVVAAPQTPDGENSSASEDGEE